MGTHVEYQTAYAGNLPSSPDASGKQVTSRCSDFRQICGERTFGWRCRASATRDFCWRKPIAGLLGVPWIQTPTYSRRTIECFLQHFRFEGKSIALQRHLLEA